MLNLEGAVTTSETRTPPEPCGDKYEDAQHVQELIDSAYEFYYWLIEGYNGLGREEQQRSVENIRFHARAIGTALIERLSGTVLSDGRFFCATDNGSHCLALADGESGSLTVFADESAFTENGHISPNNLEDSLLLIAIAEQLVNPIVKVNHH